MDNNKLLLFVIILLVAFFALSNRPTGNVVVSDQYYEDYMSSPDSIANYDYAIPTETPYYEPQQHGHCATLNSPEFRAKISQNLKDAGLPDDYISQIMAGIDQCDETGLDPARRALVDGILNQYRLSNAGDVA